MSEERVAIINDNDDDTRQDQEAEAEDDDEAEEEVEEEDPCMKLTDEQRQGAIRFKKETIEYFQQKLDLVDALPKTDMQFVQYYLTSQYDNRSRNNPTDIWNRMECLYCE